MNQEEIKQHTAIAVLGAGNIGSAMARGLASTQGGVRLYNRSAGRLEAFGETPGVELRTTDLKKAIDGASIIVLCVEGEAVEPVIKQMGKELGHGRRIAVSCAAAHKLDQLETWLKPYAPKAKIARVLPNIAAATGHSANLICSRGLNADEERALCRLFEGTGRSFIVAENLFGAAMAISSCGSANVLRYVRAATEAGVELGLSSELAKELATASLEGTASIINHTNAHPEALIDSVTTPGGLTIRGINAMEACGFSAAVTAGIKAATKK